MLAFSTFTTQEDIKSDTKNIAELTDNLHLIWMHWITPQISQKLDFSNYTSVDPSEGCNNPCLVLYLRDWNYLIVHLIVYHYNVYIYIFLIQEFQGNDDHYTVVHYDLNPPITERYIRFRPVTWNVHISMRVEIYGCTQGNLSLWLREWIVDIFQEVARQTKLPVQVL